MILSLTENKEDSLTWFVITFLSRISSASRNFIYSPLDILKPWSYKNEQNTDCLTLIKVQQG